MDIKSADARSRNMSRVRGRDTKPEKYIRSLLFKRGLRYRVHCSFIEGKPDLYFTGRNTAVFVHGCFWHRHEGCKFSYVPKSNVDFWVRKFQANIKRDQEVLRNLKMSGIRVIVIWECTVKAMMNDPEREAEVAEDIIKFLQGTSPDFLEL